MVLQVDGYLMLLKQVVSVLSSSVHDSCKWCHRLLRLVRLAIQIQLMGSSAFSEQAVINNRAIANKNDVFILFFMISPIFPLLE